MCVITTYKVPTHIDIRIPSIITTSRAARLRAAIRSPEWQSIIKFATGPPDDLEQRLVPRTHAWHYLTTVQHASTILTQHVQIVRSNRHLPKTRLQATLITALTPSHLSHHGRLLPRSPPSPLTPPRTLTPPLTVLPHLPASPRFLSPRFLC